MTRMSRRGLHGGQTAEIFAPFDEKSVRHHERVLELVGVKGAFCRACVSNWGERRVGLFC
jgi:hypothetical protein